MAGNKDQLKRFNDIALAIVLVFIGLKMVLADLYKVPVVASLIIIAAILTGSLLWGRRKGDHDPAPPPPEGTVKNVRLEDNLNALKE